MRSDGEEADNEEGIYFPCFCHYLKMKGQSPSRYVSHLWGSVLHIGPSLEHTAESAWLMRCNRHEHGKPERAVHETAQSS